MARGGPRPGSGRKPGGANKKTRAIADQAAAGGLTPLEFLLQVMRSEPSEDAGPTEKLAVFNARFEAAKAAAPYVHPRLSSINAQQTVQGSMSVTVVSEFPDE